MAFFDKAKLNNYLWKVGGYPQFCFWVSKALAKSLFSGIVKNHAKMSLNYMYM